MIFSIHIAQSEWGENELAPEISDYPFVIDRGDILTVQAWSVPKGLTSFNPVSGVNSFIRITNKNGQSITLKAK